MRDEIDETATLSQISEQISEQRPIDPALLAQLKRTIAQHRPKILRVCNRIVCNPELAEDLAQETLFVALRKLSTFQGRSQMSTWLCGIARHLALNAVRKHGEMLTEDGLIEADSDQASVLKTISKQERDAVLRTVAARCLDSKQQEIVHLRYIENLDHKNIESMLGLTNASGVRGALQTIHRTLGRELRAELVKIGQGTSTYVRSIT